MELLSTEHDVDSLLYRQLTGLNELSRTNLDAGATLHRPSRAAHRSVDYEARRWYNLSSKGYCCWSIIRAVSSDDGLWAAKPGVLSTMNSSETRLKYLGHSRELLRLKLWLEVLG